MKKILLSALLIFSITQLKAQNFEFSIHAGSGLSHFSGSSAISTSYMAGTPQNTDNSTNDPYGSHVAAAYNAGLQGQYVFKNRFILGMQASYQLFQSKVRIDSILRDDLYQTAYFPGPYYAYRGMEPASGQTIFRASYINFSPYIGYRILAGKIKLDILPGMDLGIGLDSREKGKAATTFTTSNIIFYSDKDRGTPKTDLGLNLGLAAYYHRVGLTTGYSYGLSNYLAGGEGTSLHTQFSHLGLACLIN